MRSLIIVIAAMFIALAASAKGELTFQTRKVDFGNVKADGGAVTVRYPFTNTGDEAVGIVTVTNGGCGCTKPSFPTAPVKPGQSGEIVIHFEPRTFRGEVQRSVKVKISSQRQRITLTFGGVVIP